jgi:hypothetical protein
MNTLNIYQINELLKEAVNVLNELPEYKKVKELKALLHQKYEERKQLSEDELKQELIKLGFEVRTSHKVIGDKWVSTTNDFDFIIVHKSQPDIELVRVNIDGSKIKVKDNVWTESWKYYGIGTGKDEESAWQSAVLNYAWNTVEKTLKLVKDSYPPPILLNEGI